RPRRRRGDDGSRREYCRSGGHAGVAAGGHCGLCQRTPCRAGIREAPARPRKPGGTWAARRSGAGETQMSDPDNFLTRWSRRKRENEAKPAKIDSDESKQAALENPSDKPVTSGKAAPAEPEFDISKLPPIESIGAETDISAFMQKGVPSALQHAAL